MECLRRIDAHACACARSRSSNHSLIETSILALTPRQLRIVNSTVCASRPLSWRGQPLRKVSDGVFWTYNLPAEKGEKSPRSLASCSAMGGGTRPGLCTANLPYGDLVLTIHFSDNQIGLLEALYNQSSKSLQAWER